VFFLLPDDHFLDSSFIARIESNDLYLDITPLSNRRDHSIRQTFLVLLLQILISIISIDKYIEIIPLPPLLNFDNFDITFTPHKNLVENVCSTQLNSANSLLFFSLDNMTDFSLADSSIISFERP
jgi:hypothetical protein